MLLKPVIFDAFFEEECEKKAETRPQQRGEAKQVKSNPAHLLLCDAHLVSPVHEHQVGLLFGKLLHLLGRLPRYPLPLRHFVPTKLVLHRQREMHRRIPHHELLKRRSEYLLKSRKRESRVTEAIFRLSRMCILSKSFSGTGSELSRYARRPVGWRGGEGVDREREMKKKEGKKIK